MKIFRLFISKDKAYSPTDFISNEYVFSSSEDVCEVISKLSHLKLIFNLTCLDVVTSDDCLKDFGSDIV